MNIQHSSRTDLWYTPLSIILAVKEVLGEIDLDPATDQFANSRIQAKYIITEDSLQKPWPIVESLYLNPPGGKTGTKSNTILFWKELMRHKANNGFKHAIFMAFSAEALQTSQDKGVKCLLDFPICIPSKRIKFDSQDGGKFSPSHSNCIVYIPNDINRTDKFIEVFSKIGACKK